MNTELNNERVYFICLLSKIFDLPANIAGPTEKIVVDIFLDYDLYENLYISYECVSIAAIMYVCKRNYIELDAQLIDEFVSRIFNDSDNCQMSRTSVDRHYKRISENYRNVDISKLNESNNSIQILNITNTN
ncbi:hypothetical protein [Methanosarcina sp. UBA5]|uniref:hypothetical protein n=1 Tax=Methanosarcina sp. UBA5 TaxID=1915593 RepID=UPI0025E50FA0|nr:hypothetical protein [Methanosarcina sp. UBA5]